MLSLGRRLVLLAQWSTHAEEGVGALELLDEVHGFDSHISSGS